MAMLQVCSGGPKYVTAMETPEKSRHRKLNYTSNTSLKGGRNLQRTT
jgi:hypothetical protein